MFDPDKNLISLSNEDGSGDELQRAQAAWFLSVLCKLDAGGKDDWATKDLAIVRRWYGLDSSVSLIDAAGKTTKVYAELQDVFAATYIAWLIEGANLPPVAEAVAKPLRRKYSSASQVSGAKLDDEIGRLFRGMLGNESKDQPPLTAGSRSTGKSLKPKDQPLERGRSSILRKIVSALFWYRTDLAGRLRVVLWPALLPAIGEAIGGDVYGPLDWEGLLSALVDTVKYSGVVPAVVILAFLIMTAWLISGAAEGISRWLIFGNRPADH